MDLDEYHAHEVLHGSSICCAMFSREVLEHPYVQANADLKREAERVNDVLYNFYTMIGMMHLERKLDADKP
jgi:hypothetical protein